MPYEFTQTYQRSDRDFYVEPRWAVEALIKAVPFEGTIYDPACGSGTIPKTFAKAGFLVAASDLKDRGYGTPGVNFLQNSHPWDNIVCNPPYNLSEAFIKKGLKFAKQRVAILARVAFLNGQKRHKLYTEFPPEIVVILSRRPSMPPGGMGIVASGGKTDFCWIVWNKNISESKICWAL